MNFIKKHWVSVVPLLAAVVVGVCGFSVVYASEEEYAWWGQSGATQEPYKDASRSGYWWWPTQAQSNERDAELWGNRGVVYGQLTQHAEVVEEQPEEIPIPVEVVREIPVLNDVLFDFDKAVIKTAGLAVVDRLVAELKEHPDEMVQIAGHTCSVGPEEYNDDLSKRRANAIREYLINQGVEPDRVYAAGYGERDPKAANDSPETRKLNRRAVFTIVVPEEAGD